MNESSQAEQASPTTKAEADKPDTPAVPMKQKKFPVIELFGPVIQGEGSQAGQQTMFIRFGGCDYRCKKCDSMHAVEPQAIAKHAQYLTADEIHNQLNSIRDQTGVQWVTFSGGNPAMHKLDELVQNLRGDGWLINVETQGTLYPAWLQGVHLVTTSPKSMGMGEKFEQTTFMRFLEKHKSATPVCVKVVVFSAQDLEFALQVQQATEHVYTETLPYAYPSAQHGGVAYYLSLGNPFPPVLNEENELLDQQPIGGLIPALLRDYRNLSEEVLLDPRLKSWRFLPQLHVLTYGNEAQR